ncbi:hypothetical protein FOMPIDRAFT_1050959 [Fomitopsis schrenkii]|uniref:IRG-type G domain-containing protein n=1 Tax=Fomitopsis schrenkii TaxID=2126942 RepID=S8FBI7_FOMSC|nr:hypothetical protein FOMPIDRAFT_1050959 [Fomitopsis schrenkii]
MGAVASVFAPPPPTLASVLFSWRGTLLVTGITVLASAISTAGVATDEHALRRNPAMRDAEERIRQLEAQLGREQQEGTGRRMLAAVRSVLQITETRRRLRYVDGLVHFAVAGTAGSGKSSLINSIRGLRASDPGAAAVGTSETTTTVTRHEDPDLVKNPFVWYDIPGVGTLNQPEAAYFLEQGLFIFDCVIVVFDARFTAADIAILKCCQKLDIPAYIVRSKALVHIQNTMEDMAGGGSTTGDWTSDWQAAQEKFVRETQATVDDNLKAAGLEKQRVYVVDKKTMLQYVSGEDPGDNLLDERELLSNALGEMLRRREAR